jgi:hypothetical protein
MAPAGRGLLTSSRTMATRCRWRSLPRLRTPTTKSIQRPQSTPWADRSFWSATVGHSYGGSIITEAGNHPNVKAPVYIAAFALDEGESCASIEQAVPQASKAFTPDSNGLWWIDQAHFAAEETAKLIQEAAASVN